MADDRVPGRGFWFMRDVPLVTWFVAIVAAAVFRSVLPWPTWILLHLVFLGAITHAILVFSGHFTNALTRTRVTRTARRNENLRLAAANVGALLVLVGVPNRAWPVTIAGATILIVAVLLHCVSLTRRYRAALPGRFTGTVRFYISAALVLPIGSGIGVWITLPGQHAASLTLAHALVNVLGWIGLTVAGTLVTLWPTMLRTRVAEHSARDAARALPLLSVGVVAAAFGAAVTLPAVVAIGLATYLFGLAVIGRLLIRVTRTKRPQTAATLFAGSAVVWWFLATLALTVTAVVATFTGADQGIIHSMLHRVAPFVAAGFAAQILTGALSYLMPVLLGGGPNPVRVGTAILDRFAHTRVIIVNASLVACAVTSIVGADGVIQRAAWAVSIAGLAMFIPLAIASALAQRRAGAPRLS